MTKKELQARIGSLTESFYNTDKETKSKINEFQFKLDRLIDYLGLEEKSDEYIDKEPNCNNNVCRKILGYWNNCGNCIYAKSKIVTRKYFVKKENDPVDKPKKK